MSYNLTVRDYIVLRFMNKIGSIPYETIVDQCYKEVDGWADYWAKLVASRLIRESTVCRGNWYVTDYGHEVYNAARHQLGIAQL